MGIVNGAHDPSARDYAGTHAFWPLRGQNRSPIAESAMGRKRCFARPQQ